MMGMFCPRCRSLVPPGAGRCGTCGAGLGSLVESSQSVLDGAAPRPAAPAVTGRRNPDAPYMPYEPRENQLIIIEDIVRALDEGRHFVMESGTGTGKTVVALAAALDHASRTGKKVVYLTRTNSQCDQVMRELRAISQIPGVRTLTGVPVVGRGRSCPLFRGVKDYDSIPSNVLSAMCRDAKQKSASGQAGGCRYFDRVEYSLPGIRSFVQANLPTSSDLDAYCVRMQVCPYEAKKALMRDAQVVAAPYVHILDPEIREGFLSNLGCPGDPKGLLIIVDEAHNLIDAARDSESASMGRDLVDAAMDECTTFTSEPRIGEVGLRGFLSFLKAAMRGLATERVGLAGSEAAIEGPVLEEALMKKFSLTRESLNAFIADMEGIGEQRTKRLLEAGGRRISEIQQVAEFLRRWCGASGSHYVRSVSVDADGERLHAHCIDPSDISVFLNSTKGTVHMSGTLRPLGQYARVIGLTEERTRLRTYPSPFPAENRLVLYDEGVTMEYTTLNSDPDMRLRVQERIADLCNAVDRNTLVLFTSYKYMNNMRGYLEGHIRKRMYWERSGDPRGNTAALASFRSRRDGVLFCVMGGNFAEGIDFPGEELCFAVIVGIPYPPPSVVQKGMSDMFDARFGQGKGWTYYSHVPAQRKIAQAIGRLIRTETDRGAAVILDRRAERMGRELGARPTTDPVGEVAAFFRRCARDEHRKWTGTAGIPMRLIDALCDVKVWIAAGIIAGLAFGFDDPNASTILVVVLILQMSVALDGIRFSRDDLRSDARRILGCMLACFVLNTGLTLLVGLAFLGDRSLWTGWVMLASMPCAVSVVVSSIVMRGDTKMAVLALAVIYVAALVLTPAITGTVLGSAADPLEILRYIALFIAVPFALSPLVRGLGLRPEARSVIINVMMMLMVLIGLGSRRDYILDNLDVVLWLALACAVRTFAVGAAMVWAMRRRGVRREDGVVYLTMGVWKNSGMSISMTMALFGAVMPEAVLPCVVSLVVESVWFAVMSRLVDVLWPADADGTTLRRNYAGHAPFDSILPCCILIGGGYVSLRKADARRYDFSRFRNGVRCDSCGLRLTPFVVRTATAAPQAIYPPTEHD